MIILLAALAAELFMSGYPYLAYAAGKDGPVDMPVEEETVTFDDETKSHAYAFEPCELTGISFETKGSECEYYYTLKVYASAEEDPVSFRSVLTKRMTVTGKSHRNTIYMKTPYKAAGIMLVAEDAIGELVISDVKINPSFGPSFSLVRFLIIAVLAELIWFFGFSGTGRRIMNALTIGNIAVITVSLCASFSLIFSGICMANDGGVLTEYPENPEAANPYIQQLDAFEKGQLYLDVEPSRELLEAENPYDPISRGNVHLMWDRAFFDGKYYSYFGTAPIFTVYYPVYLLTEGLPTDAFVMAIFALITSVFLPLAVIYLSKIIDSRIPPVLAGFAGAAALGASMIFMIQRGYAPFYYIASAAGTAFASMTLFFLVRAYLCRKNAGRIALFCGAGLSLALCFHSRLNSFLPVGAVSALLMIIRFVRAVKSKKTGKFIPEAAALCLPLAAGIAAAMWYNNARFGSPFDFGSAYQLTVADTSKYGISLSGLFPMIFYYFLKPFEPTASFPFIGMNQLEVGDYGGYLYCDTDIGIFAMPFMLLLFGSYFVLKSKKVSAARKTALAGALAVVIASAFADFCLGGVIFRYTGDIAPMCAFISAAVLFEIYSLAAMSGEKIALNTVKKGGTLLCMANIAVTFASAFIVNPNLCEYSSSVYEALRSFFVFWK